MLLDHFHPPLSDRYGWRGFHNQWASVLAADLNTRLPPGWHAETDVQFGIEIDVGLLDEQEKEQAQGQFPSQPWTPPAPTLTIPFAVTTDRVEIRVINRSYSPWLVGAIELVSPANKDRQEHRDAFVTKCASILSEGAGLVVVDIVTDRHANLHRQLVEWLGDEMPGDPELYAGAYHPSGGASEDARRLRIWYKKLDLGQPLPTMPLYLHVGQMVPIDLHLTYRLTCEQLRIPIDRSNEHDN